jgi:hypothetical protein
LTSAADLSADYIPNVVCIDVTLIIFGKRLGFITQTHKSKRQRSHIGNKIIMAKGFFKVKASLSAGNTIRGKKGKG